MRRSILLLAVAACSGEIDMPGDPTDERFAEVPIADLIPASECVNGPSAVGFDPVAFVPPESALGAYREFIEGRRYTGPEIVALVAHRYSVNPRLLLALLELRGSYVTATQRTGPLMTGGQTLYGQLLSAARLLNRGFYDAKDEGKRSVTFATGGAQILPDDVSWGTCGVARFLAAVSSRTDFARLAGAGEGSFAAAYEGLFGDPFARAVEPLLPDDLAQPELLLPFPGGQTWRFTGAPHAAWDTGSAWAGLDFSPGRSGSFDTAVAPGVIVSSALGEVMQNLDGLDTDQEGWVVVYNHVATAGRLVTAGQMVDTGAPLGSPSNEGGVSTGVHLHIARKYNGVWLRADGEPPFVLSGWTPHSDGVPYNGSLTRGDERVTAMTGASAVNAITSDNRVLEAEPNDGASQAQAIPLPSTTRAALAAGDVDRWKITVGSPVRLRLETLAGDAPDTIVRVADASGQELGVDDDGGAGLLSLLRVELPQAGTYTVTVTGYRQTTAGAYLLAASTEP